MKYANLDYPDYVIICPSNKLPTKTKTFRWISTVCNDSAITLLNIHKPPAFILRLVLTAQFYLCSFITVTSFVKVHMLFQPQNILYMFS